MNSPLDHLYLSPDLAFEFWAVFSRMEYALKASGFVTSYDKHGEKVLTCWSNFAKKYETSFDPKSNDELNEAVNYLIKNPPRKQCLIGDELDFKLLKKFPKLGGLKILFK